MTIKKSYVNVLFSALAALLVSCVGPEKYPVSNESGTYFATTSPPRKTVEEIQQLTRAADSGSGEAAYMLSRYYSNAGRNAELAIQYEKLALTLEYPIALYRAAVREWASEPKPDMERIETRARKAIKIGARELDVARVQELLDEVMVYRKAGVVPSRTKLRLVLEPRPSK